MRKHVRALCGGVPESLIGSDPSAVFCTCAVLNINVHTFQPLMPPHVESAAMNLIMNCMDCVVRMSIPFKISQLALFPVLP